MKKFLLNYNPGSKGDFLTNFFNTKQFFSDNLLNKSKVFGPSLHRSFNNIEFENVIKKDFVMCCGHRCHLFSYDIMKKYNCSFIQLNVEEFYMKTVAVEYIFKTAFHKFSVFDFLKDQNNFYKENFTKFKKIEYFIDIDLIKKELEINDFNRRIELEYKLNNLNDLIDEIKQHNNATPSYASVINYEQIYIKKNYFFFFETFKDFDENLFNNLLKKTWLPEKFNIFGKLWQPKDYGYLSNIDNTNTI